jgi:cytochrome c oxidase subunit 3
MAGAHTKNHDYHLVEPSPWPFIASVGAFIIALGSIAWMRYAPDNSFELFWHGVVRLQSGCCSRLAR